MIFFSNIIKVHTGFHHLITSCQTFQQENKCKDVNIKMNEEDKCEKIFFDCESLFNTLLVVYKNDINTRDEKGNLFIYLLYSLFVNSSLIQILI